MVSQAQAHELEQENRRLRLRNEELERRIEELKDRMAQRDSPPSSNHKATADAPRSGRHSAAAAAYTGGNAGWTPAGGEDALYQRFLERLRTEQPKLLRVAATKPELEVSVERRTIEASDDTLFGRCALLIAEGFFDSGNTGNTAFNELTRRGRGSSKPNVYKELDKLTAMGFLTKEGKGEGYRAVPGMKVNIVEG